MSLWEGKCLACSTHWKQQNVLPLATKGESVWKHCLKFSISPLVFDFRPFPLVHKRTWRSSREKKNSERHEFSPSCPVILLLALCSGIIVLTLLPSTTVLPRAPFWYLTYLPHSHPSKLESEPPALQSPIPFSFEAKCQNTQHQSISLRTHHTSEKPQVPLQNYKSKVQICKEDWT